MFCEHPQTKSYKREPPPSCRDNSRKSVDKRSTPPPPKWRAKKCKREKKNRPNHGALRCGRGTMRRAQVTSKKSMGKKQTCQKKIRHLAGHLVRGFFFLQGGTEFRALSRALHCLVQFFFFFFSSLALLFVQCRQSDYWVGFMTCTCAHLTPFDWGCLHVNHLLTSFWWHASVCGWLPLFVLWFELVFWQVALTLYRYKKSF